MKFALENFQVDRNKFSQKFLGLQSTGKAFAKKYRQIAPSSATAITLSMSAATIQALIIVADAQGAALMDRTFQKTLVKKSKKVKKNRKLRLQHQMVPRFPCQRKYTNPIPGQGN